MAPTANDLTECDRKLETMLAALQIHKVDISQKKRRSNVKNSPKFDLRTYLIGLYGVDSTRIDDIEVTTAMKVLGEVGADMSRFKSAKQFASWLGMCSGTKISGGKVLSGASKRTANRAAQSLRMAAVSIEIQSVCTWVPITGGYVAGSARQRQRQSQR